MTDLDTTIPTTHRTLRPGRLACLVACVVLAAFIGLRTLQPAPPAVPVAGVMVEGDARFVSQVRAALQLLEQKDPDAHHIVREYVPRIVQGRHSGMWAYDHPPKMEIAPPTAGASTTWLASSIAHDSMHSRLYHDYRRAHGWPVPDAQWTGTAVERACCQYQTEVLKHLGADRSEIDWSARQDGTHADVNRDGKLDWTDWEQRNW